MKKNKLILFDWGGIVEDNFGYEKYDEVLLKKCGYSGNKKFNEYELSSISTKEEFEEFFNQIKKDYDLIVDIDEFINIYTKLFNKSNYFRDVRDYEISLKNKCYVGILSNLCIYDKERIDRELCLKDYDYVFLSFELACRKPDRVIYEKVQGKLPFDKKDILFIDDRIENVEMAKSFGWNAFCASGLELDKIKEICEEFLNN